MHPPAFLTEFLVVLAAAALVALVFDRFRLPHLLGFLLAGVVLGSDGFRIFSDTESIHQMAEFGVFLLMLTIGLEFSVARLKGLRRLALGAGVLQLAASIFLGVLFAFLQGWPLGRGVMLGSVIALSSTAIVLKYLLDRGETDTHHGRIAVAILIFQDLAVAPLLILTKGLDQPAAALLPLLGTVLLKTGLLIGGALVLWRFILPPVLRAVARNHEIFFLAAGAICLGTAWVSEQLGLSLAIGAFLAGFMFANTDYGPQLAGEITPFRHIFVSVFFVSLGLLFDPGFTLQHAPMVLLVVGLILTVNIVVVTLIVMGFGFPPRVALAAGILLAQIGEFSFILIEAAHGGGETDRFFYQLLLSAAFISMIASPFLFRLIPVLFRVSENIPFFGLPPAMQREKPDGLDRHIILCGYGASGVDLAESFSREGIPFLILEMNPVRVKAARAKGIHVIYGDAANREVMHRAHLDRAAAVVVSFADPVGLGQIVRVVQQMNPEVFLAVRTRFESEIARLYDLGADSVVLEEWEASVQLNRLVLERWRVPAERITAHLERIRMRHELVVADAIITKEARRS